MSEIKNGLLIDNLITQNIIAFIEHQPLDLKDIQAIVIHQTETFNAKDTIKIWQTKPTGAHFLIDRGGDGTHTGVDGKIYQTARMNKRCHHVGFLQSRCLIENTCVIPKGAELSAEAKADALKPGKTAAQVKANAKIRNSAVNKIEQAKSYPNRFPNNEDSIGIELVAKFDYKTKLYPPPSQLQILAVSYLIEQIVANLPAISVEEDIYTHGGIARKEATEGTRAITVYSEIKTNAALYPEAIAPKK